MKYHIFLYLIISTFFSCSEKNRLEIVTTNGRQILVNDSPYFIKGICYHPVPKGSDDRSFETIDTDLALMVEAAINTLRVYAPIDDVNVLDKIDAAGLGNGEILYVESGSAKLKAKWVQFKITLKGGIG